MKLIIFMIHQLLTIFENSYLGIYWALKNGSPLIFYLMDREKDVCIFIFIFYCFYQTYSCWKLNELVFFTHPESYYFTLLHVPDFVNMFSISKYIPPCFKLLYFCFDLILKARIGHCLIVSISSAQHIFTHAHAF